MGLEYELRQLDKVKDIVQIWLDKQGHERCWYYPELFQELANVLRLEPKVPPNLPERKEFKGGCKRYADEQYKDG